MFEVISDNLLSKTIVTHPLLLPVADKHVKYLYSKYNFQCEYNFHTSYVRYCHNQDG